jgi:hypothetical protein
MIVHIRKFFPLQDFLKIYGGIKRSVQSLWVEGFLFDGFFTRDNRHSALHMDESNEWAVFQNIQDFRGLPDDGS